MYQKGIKSTQFGFKTPHGFRTPHKLPRNETVSQDIMNLVEQLYPTGRAWKMPENSSYKKLHQAINLSFLRLIDTFSTLPDSCIPDSSNFTEDDCIFWEYKLGIFSNSSQNISQRRNAILHKISFRKRLRPRQNLLYLHTELDSQGFNVKIYENIFFDVSGNIFRKFPKDISSSSLTETQHASFIQHGEGTQHGAGNYDVIANSVFNEEYSIGGSENLWATFFISSKNSLEQRAVIPEERKIEFKELVLKLKPAHLVGFVFVDYI